MAVDNTNNFAGMDSNSPSNTENWAFGAEHIRALKTTLKRQFPGRDGNGLLKPVAVTADELNTLEGSNIGTTLQVQIDDIGVAGSSIEGRVGVNEGDIVSLNSDMQSTIVTADEAHGLAVTADNKAADAQALATANQVEIGEIKSSLVVLGMCRFNSTTQQTLVREGIITGITRYSTGNLTVQLNRDSSGVVITTSCANAVAVVTAHTGTTVNIAIVKYDHSYENYLPIDDVNVGVVVHGYV